MGEERLTSGFKKKEIKADKEEACGGDTDPAMTAAGSTTTRGSGFFCVSLESGRKVGKNYTVKERLTGVDMVTAMVNSCYAKSKPCKTTSVMMFITKWMS